MPIATEQEISENVASISNYRRNVFPLLYNPMTKLTLIIDE